MGQDSRTKQELYYMNTEYSYWRKTLQKYTPPKTEISLKTEVVAS